jgi:hypothetical protein
MTGEHREVAEMVGSWDAARVARWTGVLGILIPTIGLVIYQIWSFPGTRASGADIASWAAANHGRLVATMLFYTIGVTMWLTFGAAVWSYLRNRLPTGSTLPIGFGAGLIAYVTLLLAGFTAFNLLLYRLPEESIATLLYDLTFGLLAMSGMPTAMSLTFFAVAVYRQKMLSRFTAHLAVATAAAHVLLLVGFIAHAGPLSLEGFSITGIPALLWAWILTTALSMPREAAEPDRPSPRS